MRISKWAQSNHRALQLSMSIGLAALLLAILLWTSASSTPATALKLTTHETATLNDGTVITIGVAASLSMLESVGWPQANAVQLAISQTNAMGGLNLGSVTYTLKVVTVDSACDATQAVTAANTLMEAGAVAVVGHTCSGASRLAQPIYSAAGVPMVSPSSTAPDLTGQGYTNTFRVLGTDDAPAILMATYFRQWLRLESAAVVELDGFWGDISPAAFSNTFTSLGGIITSRHIVSSTDDYTTTLTAIQAENPDAIFYADTDPNNAGFLSSIAHTQSMSDVTIGWDTWDGDLDTYATEAGPAAEGDYASSFMITATMPGYPVFNAAYQAAGFLNYGEEAETYGAFAYDAANIIIAAMNRADSIDPMAIRDEIAATADYEGVVGTYEGFDANGDVIPQWAVLARYYNGRWMILHPSKVFLPIMLNTIVQ